MRPSAAARRYRIAERRKEKEMHWITHIDPKRDGNFLVALGYRDDVRADVMNFTVEGGWNSYRDSNGELHTSKVMKDYHVGSSDYIRGWQLLPRWRGRHEFG